MTRTRDHSDLNLGNIPGVSTNTTAGAGNIGEILSSTGTSGTLTNGTVVALTSLNLTAGDWDIWCQVQPNTSGSSVPSDYYVTISTTSASLGTPITNSLQNHYRITASNTDHSVPLSVAPIPVQLSSTTTHYLNFMTNFTGTAFTASYVFIARRIR